ncbi:hypothetical protein BpHYR1_008890 [Brachionus plicatilis]|uniref:Uncharacterized protein n=1 Tax=Brachionus plicatilis TaxID=10195 RepID=A0A3M7QMF8_BRAPC|nr:hypothetical protein BpHYR1_008890 [Brachionus plicatilis]
MRRFKESFIKIYHRWDPSVSHLRKSSLLACYEKIFTILLKKRDPDCRYFLTITRGDSCLNNLISISSDLIRILYLMRSKLNYCEELDKRGLIIRILKIALYLISKSIASLLFNR